jgi:hypothetical protein
MNYAEQMRSLLILLEDMPTMPPATKVPTPSAQTKDNVSFNGIDGPLNINSLAMSLGIKNVSVFSQALARLKNPPPGANITKILTVPQMAELATAFYLILTDSTGNKAQVLNQIRQLTTGQQK